MESRRKFLQKFSAGAGCFVLSASSIGLTACQKSDPDNAKHSIYSFPHGVASADPKSDAIMLWTRLIGSEDEKDIQLTVQLSDDENFENLRAEKTVIASQQADYTIRVFVDKLDTNRYYYYRFIAPDGLTSQTGRTRTAPAADDSKNLNIAVFSCQHFFSGFSSVYRRLINDDLQADESDKIDVLMHLGDVIYESAISGFPDLDGNPIDLKYKDGRERGYQTLPSGGEINKNGWPLAVTLADFRHLYKAMLSDPDMQAARARYPFIYTWDDHELINDAWQSYHPAGNLQKRRVAASQAWFEYIPAILDQAYDGPGVKNAAHSFKNVEVEDHSATEFDENYLSLEPNNLAAIRSMTIYRSFKWGSMADLILMDCRSYRGPRGVPDEILKSPGIPYPTEPVPTALIRTTNSGRLANNGNPPETVEYQGVTFPNERKDKPVSSMLGGPQKQWVKTSLKESRAKWKILCNSTPMMKFGFDTTFRGGTTDGIFWTDSWDGYPVERDELMDFVKNNQLPNVVSLAGDRHAHFAGYILNNSDDAKSERTIPEFAGASVSATCRVSVQKMSSGRDSELKPLVSFDGTPYGFDNKITPSLNAWLLYGAESARELSQSGNESQAKEKAVDFSNPHLAYADNDAYGYYIARFTSDELDVEFVTMPEPITDYGIGGPPVLRRVSYKVMSWGTGEQPELLFTKQVGSPPLMGLKQIG
jgi:alkaline phosphatase D